VFNVFSCENYFAFFSGFMTGLTHAPRIMKQLFMQMKDLYKQFKTGKWTKDWMKK